jgi:type I restriction enzyme M protein
MDQATHNKIVSFIWGIADDVLRDLFKRGKYPDVILPMCVIRRLDAVLEQTKRAVIDTKKMLDGACITEQRAALCDAAGQAFYNTSKFRLRDLKSRGSQQQLLADFEDYLNGFSQNVQDILENFKFQRLPIGDIFAHEKGGANLGRRRRRSLAFPQAACVFSDLCDQHVPMPGNKVQHID